MPNHGGVKTVRFQGTSGPSRDSDDNWQRNKWNKDAHKRNFKPSLQAINRLGAKGKFRISELALKGRLEEDDDMSDFQSRKGDYNRNARKFETQHKRGQRLVRGSYDWFLVTIPYGHNYEREFILTNIKDHLGEEKFAPYLWKQDKDSVSFFVDDFSIAEKLFDLDRKIPLKGNLKMIIKVRSGIPSVQIDETLKEKMKVVMSKRYKEESKALDLARFHTDPDLVDAFCPLFRPPIMLAAFDIMHQYIPHLEALNLSENKIHHLDHFKCIKEKLPCLKILHLENNRIQSLGAIEALRGLPLIELVLNGNPIKERYSKTYVSEIRKRLPKLEKLDGIEAPPSIGFDVTEETVLPTPKASFLVSTNGADVIRTFIEQYFAVFDSNNRQPLLDAYHENAMFSITVASAGHQNERVANFWPYNRNLFRRRETDTADKHMKIGKVVIVNFFSELPSTRHDPQSMAVDFCVQTPHFVNFTVTGVFTELSEESNQDTNCKLRSFHRTFVIEPYGTGYIISHEMLHIASASQLQVKVYASSSKQASINQPTPQAIPQSPERPISPLRLDPERAEIYAHAAKLQLMQMLSQQTRMNLAYCHKCLEDNDWNFQVALEAFGKMHAKNLVPPEAFMAS